MNRVVSSGLLCLVLLVTPLAQAKKKHPKPPAQFDYYLLSLSWAPNFCASHPSDHSSECTVGNHTAFVLHGLWPQSNSGAPPMACAPASPVAKSIVDRMLQFMPSASLIQHEWEKHGTCSGLQATDYFAKVEQAFKSVQVPQQYPDLKRSQKFGVSDVESSFATQNRAPEKAFRISCHAGDLVGLEVCLNKNLEYQACTKTVHECSSNQVLLRPTK
jgi:ribonuclease T2